MADSKTIFFAGGGTGGHLYPGIAMALALRQSEPGLKPVFLCTQREIDGVILGPTGFESVPQPIVPWTRTVSGTLRFSRSWWATRDLVARLVDQHRPVAVVGLGGYAAGVAVKFCAEKGIPAAILNPDVIPGKANRFLLKYARVVCCQFEASGEYMSAANRKKIRVTGCPIRPELCDLPPRESAAARLGLDPMLSTLVVTGASLGAQTVNEAVLALLSAMTGAGGGPASPAAPLHGWQVLHLAGREHAESVRTEYRGLAVIARVIDFTADMADVWAVADLAVSRAGASSCAELTACGVPAVLMPYPFHKDMHQRANARVLEAGGAAVVIEDQVNRAKNAEKLRPAVEGLLFDADRRRAMAAAARKLGRPRAAEDVGAVVMELIRSGR